MTSSVESKASGLSLKAAFEAELTRRDAERHAREEAERRQAEADLDRAAQLESMLGADPDFLRERGVSLERRRYTVVLEHPDFRIQTYFEAGVGTVTALDKRSATTSGAPRKQQAVESVEDALLVMAQFLADEIR